MKINSSIQIFHTNKSNIDLHINEKLFLSNIPSSQLSIPLQLPANIHEIKTVTHLTNDIFFKGKLLLLNNQKLLLFLVSSEQCISILNHDFIPDGELMVRFLNLSSHQLHLAVSDGDLLFKNISNLQVSEVLLLTPMIIDLEIRISKKVIKQLPKIQFKPNKSYLIVITTNRLDFLILELN